jgi:hypothetical protein
MAGGGKRTAIAAAAALALAAGARQARAEEAAFHHHADEGGPARTVVASFYLNDLGEIDAASSTFTAEFLLVLTWTDKALAGVPPEEVDWSKLWHPRLEAMNSRDLQGQGENDLWSNPELGTGILYDRYTGTFKTAMDLRKFPFDEQQLTIELEPLEETSEELRFAFQDQPGAPVRAIHERAATPALAAVLNAKFSSPEWRIEAIDVAGLDHPYRYDDSRYPQLRFTIHAERRAGYFVTRVFAVILLCVVLSWLVFFQDPADLSGRMATSVTLFLAAVAFGTFITGILPRISYFTVLDTYVFVSYVLIFLSALENVVAHRLALRDAPAGAAAARRLDRWSCLLLALAFVALHGALAIYCLRA